MTTFTTNPKKETTMKTTSKANRSRFGLLAASLLLAIGFTAGTPRADAQFDLTIVNPSFEVPGTVKIADFRDTAITGWDGVINSTDPTFSPDSGVEEVTLDNSVGDWIGFIEPNANFTAFNFFDGYQAAGGETITLDFLAVSTVNDVDLIIEFFYDSYDSANVIGDAQTISDIAGGSTMFAQSLDFTLPNSGDFVGENLGFAVTNDSSGNNWVQLDDFSAKYCCDW